MTRLRPSRLCCDQERAHSPRDYILIGVVLNSMEEARQIHLEQELREEGLEPTEEEVDVMSRIRRLREAIDELEDELKLAAASRQR